MNIWSCGSDGGLLTQHTFHVDLEVRSAGLGGDRLVYQLGPALWLLDLATAGPTQQLYHPHSRDTQCIQESMC